MCAEVFMRFCISVYAGNIDLNPLTINVPNHIETSQLICSANQLTGFYIIVNIVCWWVNGITEIKSYSKTSTFSALHSSKIEFFY